MKLANHKNYSIPILILLVCLLTIFSPAILAQTIPASVMPMITAELQKRGLTESEVRVRLLQKGIDLENIPPTELPQYQARVTAVLDELQAEKAAGKNATAQPININVGSTNQTPEATKAASATGQKNVAPIEPVTTMQEAAAEASQRVVQEAAKKEGTSAIYGHSLFTDHSLDVFRTTDGAQAPETYVLGDGDEIRITIFGASQTDIQQKITSEGSIQPTGSAKIFLKGLSLAQAREVIRERLKSSYTFRSDQLAVTIITARTIMVNVFGEAKITGGFNLSALNSALNALSVAGGPSDIGSVRNIQLIRGETRKNIDVYAFMNDPAAQFKFDLQNNDIIFVPVAKLLVSVEGAVNRPMTYEMLPNETLTDLIHYSGGLKMNVYPDFVQIKRFANGEERLMEWNLEDVRTGKIKIPLMNGDVVYIKSIGKPLDQFVDVEGSVYYPGKYDLSSNSLLSKLLNNAKPTYEAKTDILFIERLRPDSTIELLTVPFPGLSAGLKDFKLQARDRIRIMNQADYRDIDSISVVGHVRLPFKKALSINDRITAKQAIELAGGLKTSVYPVAYIYRRNLFNPSEMEYIRVEINQADNVLMQAGDQLNIYDNSTYTNVGEVNVFGAIKNPRGYTYDPSLTVRDVLTNAGGFNVGAALNRVEVFRTILSPTEKVRLELITLQVDSGYQIISPENFKLQPYDQVVVRLTPEFVIGRTVEISGQVAYPGTYVLESRQTQLSELIMMAGGLLPDADPLGSKLFRTYNNRGNISVNIEKSISGSHSYADDPIMFEGDVININRLENTVTIREPGTRMAMYSLDSMDIKNVVFHGSKSAAWYVRNYAGGFQKKADRNSVTVIMANNQMMSTKRFLFLRNYPSVKSGSVIAMQMKVPTKREIEGKKTNWEEITARSTSVMTTLLTIYLLLSRI